MTEPTLEERYASFTLAVLTGIALVILAGLYSRSQRVAAEIDYLESIPVMDVEP